MWLYVNDEMNPKNLLPTTHGGGCVIVLGLYGSIWDRKWLLLSLLIVSLLSLRKEDYL